MNNVFVIVSAFALDDVAESLFVWYHGPVLFIENDANGRNLQRQNKRCFER